VRGFPKPSLRARAHANEVGAHGHAVEDVEEDAVLGHRPVQPDGGKRFAHFVCERARTRLDEPRGLHGERGGAGDAPPRKKVLPARAEKRQRVHAVVRIKTFVLRGDKRPGAPARLVQRIQRTAILPGRPERDAQEVPFAVAQHPAAGITPRLLQRRRVEAQAEDEKKEGGACHANHTPFQFWFWQ
jgi:hypothetical protein